MLQNEKMIGFGSKFNISSSYLLDGDIEFNFKSTMYPQINLEKLYPDDGKHKLKQQRHQHDVVDGFYCNDYTLYHPLVYRYRVMVKL